MDFQKVIDSFVLLMIMGVLSRPFSLLVLVYREKKCNFKYILIALFLCMCSFALAFVVVSSMFRYSFPNLLVKTMAKIFVSYCLFTPFEQFYLYLKDGIKKDDVKFTRIILYLIFCFFAIFLNSVMK